MIAQIKGDPPDLIVLDLRMERRDSGWHLLDVLTPDPATAAIPVVCSVEVLLMETHAERLAGLGAYVEETDPDFTDPVDAFHTLWFTGAARVTQHLGPHQRELLDPGLREICGVGARMSACCTTRTGAAPTRARITSACWTPMASRAA